ncbi:hypothetical protein KDL44_10145 [bacterium]|nr:hypothetical protein [bacterium]
MLRKIAVLMIVSGIFLSACGGSAGSLGSPQPTLPTGNSATAGPHPVPFPTDTPAVHGASAIQQVSLPGSDADSSGIISANPGSASFAQVNGNDMLLVAFPGDSAFAVYGLHSGAFSSDAVHFQLQTTVPGLPARNFIGVADFDLGRWRWFPYEQSSPQIDISGFGHVSPLGNVFVAFLANDDVALTVESCWLNLDMPVWVTQPVSSLPRMGQVHSMALVDGLPAVIAQQRQLVTDNDLLYCHTATAFPAGPADWSLSEIAAGVFDPVLALELIEQPGPLPGFAEILSSNQLWYAWADSTLPAGSGDWNYSYIANVESEEMSLARIQDRAALLYESAGSGGGTKVEYAWATAPLPTGADWLLWNVADSGDPAQNYGGLSLCAVQNDLPTAIYYDYTGSGLMLFSAIQAEITAANQTYTALVEDPPLGGGFNDVMSWQGLPTMVYDQFWSVPRLARADMVHPALPEDFSWHHDLWNRGMDSPAMADLGGTLGIAWHDFHDYSVWFAYYSGPPGDAAGPADWKVAQVDSRATSGDICIVTLPGNLPGISYYVDADTQLYFASTTALP